MLKALGLFSNTTPHKHAEREREREREKDREFYLSY
jgi:hypothetical protein